MSHGRRRRHTGIMLLAGLSLVVSGAKAADRASLGARLVRDSTTIAGMLDRGATDSAFAAARVTTTALGGSGDAGFDARVMLLTPGIMIRLAHANDALPLVIAGERAAAAARDTTVWMMSLRMEAMCRNSRGEVDQGQRLCARWDELAHASGNAEYEAWAATMRGWFATRRGQLPEARRELERAVPVFERVGQHVGLVYSLNVLGVVLMSQGDYAAARERYRRMEQLAEEYGNVRGRDYALDNLALIESRIGDPSRAVAQWREVLASYERRHEIGGWLVDADNVVEVSLDLGHVDEARGLASEAVTRAERESLGMELPWQRGYLAEALWASGRHEAAKHLWRDLIAGRTPDLVDPALTAAHDLIDALTEEDSTAAALALANAVAAERVTGTDQQLRGRLACQHARLLTDAGDAREALKDIRPMATTLETGGDLELALAAWTEVVRAERRLGMVDSTRRAIAHATEVWERGRSHASDLEFRELRGEQAHVLMTEAVAFALAHPPAGQSPAAAAFATVQRFKTRTLLERVAGPALALQSAPAGLEPPLIDLDRFQHDVLAPGETFLEFVTAPDTTRVLAITRDRCRVLARPGERELVPLVDLMRESGAGGGPDAGDPARIAATRLGAALLSGLELPAGGRLIVAADGPLECVPFAALIPPGAARPLVATLPVSATPSASLLSLLRSRPAHDARRLFAIAGAPGAGLATLPGARREVEALASRYRDVDAWVASTRTPAPLTAARIASCRALHFAGHTHLDDQLPWRSGLLIGADARGGDSLLTAFRIATQPVVASLIVLSSCESAGGRAREGEGMSGLTSAFLAAGGSAVVASLWAVEDRATETLMAHFYDGLARGLTADRALANAQETLRSDPKTEAPFYWAGFVLVGDPRTTLPLERRRLPLSTWAWIGCLALALAILAAATGWSRTRAR